MRYIHKKIRRDKNISIALIFLSSLVILFNNCSGSEFEVSHEIASLQTPSNNPSITPTSSPTSTPTGTPTPTSTPTPRPPTANAPTVSNISGALVHGSQINIFGSNFGAKSPANPYFWAPLDSSAAPSTLGRVTTWAEMQNMTFAAGEGINGAGALMSSDSSGTWTARVDASGFYWSDPGQKMYIFRKLKHNFSPISSFNWKDWRVWGNINGGTPTSIANNIYNGNLRV